MHKRPRSEIEKSDTKKETFSGMFDNDNSSTINFDEFKALWRFITEWEKIFHNFDQDKSGAIDKDEFRNAMTSFGKAKNMSQNEKKTK